MVCSHVLQHGGRNDPGCELQIAVDDGVEELPPRERVRTTGPDGADTGDQATENEVEAVGPMCPHCHARVCARLHSGTRPFGHTASTSFSVCVICTVNLGPVVLSRSLSEDCS